MASCGEAMEITRAEYDEIFGSSDVELEENLDEGSDIDFDGLENENSGSENKKSGSESEEEEEVPLEWTNELTHIAVDDFVSETGITFEITNDALQIDIFRQLFGDDILAHIVTETNRYASQKLAAKPEQLARWKDVSVPELKAYFGVCIVMGINSLPCTADYWSSDPYIGNEGIKKIMMKNRFEEITRFLHFNDSSVEPPRGDENYDRSTRYGQF